MADLLLLTNGTENLNKTAERSMLFSFGESVRAYSFSSSIESRLQNHFTSRSVVCFYHETPIILFSFSFTKIALAASTYTVIEE